VLIGGGAQVCRQYLARGLVDELLIHVAPMLLGDGERLFEDAGRAELERIQVVDSQLATHVRYRVAR
jgi:dihydrofolate reductase